MSCVPLGLHGKWVGDALQGSKVGLLPWKASAMSVSNLQCEKEDVVPVQWACAPMSGENKGTRTLSRCLGGEWRGRCWRGTGQRTFTVSTFPLMPGMCKHWAGDTCERAREGACAFPCLLCTCVRQPSLIYRLTIGFSSSLWLLPCE